MPLFPSPLDAFMDDPGALGGAARESVDSAPLPGEYPDQTSDRLVKESANNARVQVRKARDLAAKGTPSWADASGNTQPVTDDTGTPLTGFDKKNSIGWDSAGQPQKISYDDSGSPVLRDPFAGLQESLDQKTGAKYLKAPGLPWRFTDYDAVTKKKADFAREDQLLGQVAAVQGHQIAGQHATAITAARNLKQTAKDLNALGISPLDEAGEPIPTEALQANINAAFDEEAKGKEATAKTWMGFGSPTDDAQKAQTDIARRRAAALLLANTYAGHYNDLNAAQIQMDAQRQSQQEIQQQILAHKIEVLRDQGVVIPGLENQSASAHEIPAPGTESPSQQEAFLLQSQPQAATLSANKPTPPQAIQEAQSPPITALKKIAATPLDFFDKLRDVKDNPAQLVPFVGGAKELVDVGQIGLAAYRLSQADKSGNPPDQEDVSMVKAYVEHASRDTTFGYKVAAVLSALPSFAGELLATGGIYTAGEKFALKAGQKALEKFGSAAGAQLLERLSARSVAKAAGETVEGVISKGVGAKALEFGARSAATLVGGAAQTLPAASLRIASETVQRMMPQFQFSENEQHELGAQVMKEGDDFAPALAKSFGDQFTEVFSEHSGGALAFIPGADKLKLLKTSIMRRWFGINPDATPGAFTKLLRNAGWHGVLGEMFEERVGDVAKSAMGLQSWAEAVPTLNQLLVEAVSFSIPGAGIAAGHAIINRGNSGAPPAAPGQPATPPAPPVETPPTQPPENQNEPADTPEPSPTDETPAAEPLTDGERATLARLRALPKQTPITLARIAELEAKEKAAAAPTPAAPVTPEKPDADTKPKKKGVDEVEATEGKPKAPAGPEEAVPGVPPPAAPVQLQHPVAPEHAGIEHVTGTALNIGGKIQIGPKPETPHAGISIHNEGDGNPAEPQRGFLVHTPGAPQRFVGRPEAMKIAKASGQLPADHPSDKLDSGDVEKFAKPVAASPKPKNAPPALRRNIGLGAHGQRTVEFPHIDDADAFTYTSDLTQLMRRDNLTAEQRKNLAEGAKKKAARLAQKHGLTEQEARTHLADYHAAIVEQARGAKGGDKFTAQKFADFLDNERKPKPPETPPEDAADRQRQMVGNVNTAMRRHAKELANLGHQPTAHQAELPEEQKSGIATHKGRITVDAAKLEKATANLDEKARGEFINAAVAEEVAHKGFDHFVKASPENRARALQLTADEPAAVAYLRQHYPGYDQLSDIQQAAEVARVIMQGKAGVTTESTWKFIADLIAHLKRILGSMTEATRRVIAEIEARMQGVRPKVEPEPSEASGIPTPTINAVKATAKEINAGSHQWRAIAYSNEGGRLSVDAGGSTESEARANVAKIFESRWKMREEGRPKPLLPKRDSVLPERKPEAPKFTAEEQASIDAAREAGGDLFGAAAPEDVQNFDDRIPPDRIAALLPTIVRMAQNFRTPERFAEAVKALGPKASSLTQSLWQIAHATGAQGPASPDWKEIYAGLAAAKKPPTVPLDEHPESASAENGDGNGGKPPGGAKPGAGGKITGGGKVGGATQTTGDEPVPDIKDADAAGKVEAGSEGSGDERVGDVPAGRGNLRLELGDGIGEGGLTRKFRDNVAAIRALRTIESEQRDATPEERQVLARYVGWGGLAEKAFQPGGDFYGEMQALGLSEDEMAGARRSTTNAHYTAPAMVQGIWDAIGKMGFKSGRITEPSMGTGNFFGFMPAETAQYSALTGIEMDNLTARIGRAIYPEAKVWNRPFEKHVMADNSQDLIVSNFPFSNADHPNDPRYNQINPNLHDYFFLKSLDKVRPGGLVVAITSIGTMDKLGAGVREVLSAKANLVAAFRLPNTMFRGNASTDVTTDLIILQKRGVGVPMDHKDWLNPVHIQTRTGDEIRINQYFRDHPSNMLGIMTSEGKMYGGDQKVNAQGNKVGGKALLSDGRTVEQLIQHIRDAIPKDIFLAADRQEDLIHKSDELEFDPNSEKDGSFVLHQNAVQVFRGGAVERPRKEIGPTTKRHSLLSGYIGSGHVALDDDGTVKRTGKAWPESKAAGDLKLRDAIEAGEITGEHYREFRDVEENYVDSQGNPAMRTVEKQFDTYAFDGDYTKADYDRIRALIPVRNSLKAVLHAQVMDADDAQLAAFQKDLNVLYDAYVKENGFLHEGKTRSAFQDDPFYPALLALEDFDEINDTTVKSDIFSKRTRPRKVPLTELSGDIRENMIRVMSQTGRVDVELQAKLSLRDPEELGDEMVKAGLIFRDATTGNYVEREEYLSGSIYEKLRAAEEAAKTDESFRKNIEELEKVKPELRPVERIGFSLGAHWIDPFTYAEFVRHIYRDSAMQPAFEYKAGRWSVKGVGAAPQKGQRLSSINAEGFGTDEVSTSDLIEKSMNLQTPTVRDHFDDGSSVINESKTKLARLAQNRLKQEFKNFVLDKPDIHEPLVKKFNELFNGLRHRSYTAPYSTLEGMNPEITLNPHQLNGVWRFTVDGKGVAAWVVGAGKTFGFIGTGMEWKRLGMASKPMYIVPNHLLRSGQTAADFYRMYPTAKILTVTERDFTAKRRQRLMARIATGNWDAVLIGHSQIGSIPVSPDLMASHIQGELAELEEALKATKEEVDPNSKSGKKRIKALEASLAAKRTRMEKLLDPRRADKALYFEELGVDALIIDEAHEFKNLNFWTKLNNIGGLGSANKETQKTEQLKVKTDYILRQNNDRNLLFATGTPIANTIAEVFLLQKYMAQNLLDAAGIRYFDDWAQTFAEVKEVAEISPDGRTFQNKAKFTEFKNMQSLIPMFRRYVDIQRQEQLKLPIPELFGGKIHNVVFQPHPLVEAYMAEVVERAEALRGGKVDPREDNWLKLNTDARKISTDPRLIDANYPDDPAYKSSRIARNAFTIWKANDYRRGTQIIFCDLYSNKSERARLNAFGEPERHKRGPKRGQPIVESVERFNVFADIRDKLVRMGVPEEQIAVIHDYEKDEDKEQLKADLNSGKIRILLGTTMKLGTGMNLQRRIVAVQSMDANYRPDQMTQREGRGIRQGNLFHEATIGGRKAEGRMGWQPVYELSKDGDLTQKGNKLGPFNLVVTRNAVERTLDSRIYQTITNKTRFIEDMMNGDFKGDTAGDISDAELRGQEMIAAASGNPLVMERFTLDNEVRDLKLSESDHDRRQTRLRKEIRALNAEVESTEKVLPYVDEVRRIFRASSLALDARKADAVAAKQKEMEDQHGFDAEKPFVLTREVKKPGEKPSAEATPSTLDEVLREPLKNTKNNPDGEAELRAFGLNGRLTRQSERVAMADGTKPLRHTFRWNYSGASASRFIVATQYDDGAPIIYSGALDQFASQKDYLIRQAANQFVHQNAEPTDVELDGSKLETMQAAQSALGPKLEALKKGDSLAYRQHGLDVKVTANEKRSLTDEEKKNADLFGKVPMVYHAEFPKLVEGGSQSYKPVGAESAVQLIYHVSNALQWVPSREDLAGTIVDQKNQLKVKQDAQQGAFPEADKLAEKEARLAEVVRLTSDNLHARTDDGAEDIEPIAEEGDTFSAASPESDATAAVQAGPKGRPNTRADRKAAVAAQKRSRGGPLARAMASVKASAAALFDGILHMPKYTSADKAIGEWQGAGDLEVEGSTGRQVSDREAHLMVQAIQQQFPNRLSRQAMMRFIDTGGDEDTLRAQMAASKPAVQKIYARALALNPEERAFVEIAQKFYADMGQKAKDAGLLKAFLQNYVSRYVDRGTLGPQEREGILAAFGAMFDSEFPASKLKTRFDHAIHRTHRFMFDLEQKNIGFRTQDIAEAMGAYAQAVNHTLTDRTLVKALHDTVEMPDGRPGTVLSGYAQKIDGAKEDAGVLLIKPKAKPKKFNAEGEVVEDYGDYQSLNHPALRGWKFAGTDEDGRTILYQADMLVHPELFERLRNTFGTSALNSVPGVRTLTAWQHFVKTVMLGWAAFHVVQTGTHFAASRINPFVLHKADPNHPLTRELLNHGMNLWRFDAQQHFGEGLAGSNLGKWLGPLGRLNDWITGFTFEEYIPGLIDKFGREAFERNMKHFAKELAAGTMTRDDVLAHTAAEANAAGGFGNERYHGDNPTRLHAERLVLLAPRFLKDRIDWVRRVFTRHGREEQIAMLTLIVTMAVIAKTLERMLTGRNDWEKPFSVVTAEREYELRSVPGDVLALLHDPRMFVSGRLSPVISRTALEGITGRDYRGRKRTLGEQLMDLIKTPIPIPVKGFVDKDAPDISPAEKLGSAMGVRTRRRSVLTDTRILGHQWQKAQGIENPDEAYPPSKYFGLKNALEDGDAALAREAYRKLLADNPKDKVDKGFKESLTKPFSGSKHNEAAFVKSLSPDERAVHAEAVRKQAAMLALFTRISAAVRSTRPASRLDIRKPVNAPVPNMSRYKEFSASELFQ